MTNQQDISTGICIHSSMMPGYSSGELKVMAKLMASLHPGAQQRILVSYWPLDDKGQPCRCSLEITGHYWRLLDRAEETSIPRERLCPCRHSLWNPQQRLASLHIQEPLSVRFILHTTWLGLYQGACLSTWKGRAQVSEKGRFTEKQKTVTALYLWKETR